MAARTNAISAAGKDKNGIMEGNIPNRGFHSDESQFTENEDVLVEVVEDFPKHRPPIEPARSKKNSYFGFRIEENNSVAVDSSLEQKLSTSDASAETKSLEKASDVDGSSTKSTTSDSSTGTKSLEMTTDVGQPSTKSTISDPSTETKSLGITSNVGQPSSKSTISDPSTETKSLGITTNVGQPSTKSTISDPSTETKSLGITTNVGQPLTKSTTLGSSTGTKSLETTTDVGQTSVEISPSLVPSSDKGLQNVTENIQLIYEGLKDMKISAKDNPGSDSAKKERKLPSTPRARSTPAKPLTSPPLTRSRSRDLRKLPSTPSSPKRSGDSDSGEIKVARGRQRMKKN